MFNCQKCGKTQPPHTKQEKIVLESRAVTYLSKTTLTQSGDPRVVGHGHEIVKELSVCSSCTLVFNGLQAEFAKAA